jgi:hypothetical protein
MEPAPALSRGTVRVLRAAVAAMRPRGHGFDQPIDDDVLAEMARYFPSLPAPLRMGFPVGLRLLEYGGPLLAGKRGRFSSLPLADARRVLDAFQHAGGLRASLVLGLRALTFLAFYQHPDVLRAMGVDWQGRAVELTRRRAELLAGGSS